MLGAARPRFFDGSQPAHDVNGRRLCLALYGRRPLSVWTYLEYTTRMRTLSCLANKKKRDLAQANGWTDTRARTSANHQTGDTCAQAKEGAAV